MNRLASTIVGLAVILLIAVRADGQDTEIGSRLKPRQGTGMVLTPEDAAIAAHRFASCIVDRRTRLSQQFLDAKTKDRADAIGSNLWREIQCVNLYTYSDYSEGQSLRMSDDVGRGMLAEALIQKQFAKVKLEPLPIQRVYHSAWSEISGRDILVEEMAECVAATDPAGITALLQTGIGSKEEAQSFTAIMPSVGRCLVQNAKLRANKVGLRAALAEELYHRLAAPAGDNAVPTGGK